MQIDDCSVHFSYEGELSDIQQWIPHAKQIFRYTRKQGLTNHIQQVAEDVFIYAQYLPPKLGRLRIKAGSCVKLVNGFVDLKFPPDVTSNGFFFDPRWKELDSEGNVKYSIHDLYERRGTDYLPATGSNFLAAGFVPEKYTNTFLKKTPGMFTGEMRKVAQVLLGQGELIPYHPYYNYCHGICTIGDTKWVIEISSDIGVIAWPLPVCKSTKQPIASIKEVVDSLGYYPIYEELESSKTASSKIKVLLKKDSLEEFYQGYPLYFECGWAFNKDGKRAQNISFIYTEDNYIIGSRYEINIITDTKSKTPIDATINRIDSGLVYGDRLNHVKVPVYALNNLISFDWYTRLSPPSGVTSWTGPVYVFFDDDDRNVVVVSRNRGNSFSGDQVEFSGNPATSVVGPDEKGSYTNRTGIGYVSGAFPHVVIDNVDDGLDSVVYSSYGSMTTIEVFQRKKLDGTYLPGVGGIGNVGTLESISCNINYYPSAHNNNSQNVVIPFFDRQALYNILIDDVYTGEGSSSVSYFSDWLFTTFAGNIAASADQDGCSPGASFYVVTGNPVASPIWQNVQGVSAWYAEGVFASSVGTSSGGPFYCQANRIDVEGGNFPGTPIPGIGDTVVSSSRSYLVYSNGWNYLPTNFTYNFSTFLDGTNTHFISNIQDSFSRGFIAMLDMDKAEYNSLYIQGLPLYHLENLTNNWLPRFFIGKP